MDFFDKFGFEDGYFVDLNKEAELWVRRFVRLLNREFKLSGLSNYRVVHIEYTSHNYHRVGFFLDGQENQAACFHNQDVELCVSRVSIYLLGRAEKIARRRCRLGY